MSVLIGIDVLGVQRYVFASNRLRDAVTGSWIVHWATSLDGALKAVREQVLFAGGGNAFLIFSNEAEAKSFTAHYTRELYDHAPGLEVAIAKTEHIGSLAEAMERLQVKLACAKLEHLPSIPQLGLSVTATCKITGLPAVGFDKHDAQVPLSGMMVSRRDSKQWKIAEERWNAFLLGDKRFSFPSEIDDMGRTYEDTSLIGVVHVDGNGIGDAIKSWLKESREKSAEEVAEEMKEWSKGLEKTGEYALQAVIKCVLRSIDASVPKMRGAFERLNFNLKIKEGLVMLPLRPVLLGGDDLTFICDGRIALHLAEVALKSFAGELEPLGKITACAGVAIIPAHAPFDRAYELAVSLCESAKMGRRKKQDGGSWIDWHIGTSRPGESIGAMRARSYKTPRYELTCRPYRLGIDSDERESWSWLSQAVLGVDGFRGESWMEHRNKLKEFRAVIHDGPEGVKHARESWTVAGKLPLPKHLEKGFWGSRTPLLDAIELLDIHLPLVPEETQ